MIKGYTSSEELCRHSLVAEKYQIQIIEYFHISRPEKPWPGPGLICSVIPNYTVFLQTVPDMV